MTTTVASPVATIADALCLASWCSTLSLESLSVAVLTDAVSSLPARLPGRKTTGASGPGGGASTSPRTGRAGVMAGGGGSMLEKLGSAEGGRISPVGVDDRGVMCTAGGGATSSSYAPSAGTTSFFCRLVHFLWFGACCGAAPPPPPGLTACLAVSREGVIVCLCVCKCASVQV